MPLKSSTDCFYLIHLFVFLTSCSILAATNGHDQLEETSLPPKCEKLSQSLTYYCNITGYAHYARPHFNNTFGHTDIDTAVAELNKYAYLLENRDCRAAVQLFLCSLFIPICINVPDQPLTDTLLLPCREKCETSVKACRGLLGPVNDTQFWNCDKYEPYSKNKMCVIEGAPTDDPNRYKEPLTTYTSATNETICGPGMIRCASADIEPNGQRIVCIDDKFVCDGRRDCPIGEDEQDCCPNKNDLWCDRRCFGLEERCNGAVDCSTGIDEQDCPTDDGINTQQYVHSILCLVAFLTTLCLLVRCIRTEDEKETALKTEETHSNETQAANICPLVLAENAEPVYSTDSLHSLEQRRTSNHYEIAARLNHYGSHFDSEYSNSAKTFYERVNDGGYSGASSVAPTYASCGTEHYARHRALAPTQLDEQRSITYSHDDYRQSLRHHDEHLPPSAPPPTPVPQIYSVDSLFKPIDIYANLNDPNKIDPNVDRD